MFHNTFYAFWLIFLFSCTSETQQKQEETPVSGCLTIMSDETFKPLVEAEIAVFEGIYPDAHIEVIYAPEGKELNALYRDSAEIIITGKPLSKKDKESFDQAKGIVNEMFFASDALALLVNPKFNNSLISLKKVKSVFSGNFKTWNEVDSTWPETPVMLVFDQSNSANLNFAIDSFGLDPQKVSLFAAGSDYKVVEYVKKYGNAMGVIGAGWISDEESPIAESLREGVKIVELKDSNQVFSSSQNSIVFKDNPLRRNIWMIRRNKKVGLGAGFLTFVMSDRGQRIILKSGLLPEHIPGREVFIK